MNETIQVLNKGFVRLEDFMGGDMAVARSARVSYGKTVTDPERDHKLIGYLLKNDHGTPFESSVFVFHIKAPLFTLRQWHRHRIGVSYNEISARYTEMKEEFYIPDRWRAQDANNKQGSTNSAFLNHKWLGDALNIECENAHKLYREMIEQGVAREMARMVLPTNLYSEMYFTCNARSLMHFIRLRSESHAQFEIQQYSDALYKIFEDKMPWTATAFYGTLDPTRYQGLAKMRQAEA